MDAREAEDKIRVLVNLIDRLRKQGGQENLIEAAESEIRALKEITGPRNLKGEAHITIPLPKSVNG